MKRMPTIYSSKRMRKCRLLGGTQRREELLEALRQGGGADVVIVQPHGCESQDSQFWIPADHRNVVIEAPGIISPWQTDMSDERVPAICSS